MKKAFNRLVALGIGCLLAVSSPFSSFALNDGSLNGGGSGSNQTGSTIEYIASFHAYQINNGIQASIVKKSNGELVSNVVTMNSYLPTEIDQCPDKAVEKYWNAYVNKTGTFDTRKTHMLFLNGSKTDNWFVQSRVDLANPVGGVAYMNHSTGEIEFGKMYTYADIEYVMKAALDNYYTIEHPEYASAYQAAGGSPINPSGGVYASTEVTRNILGPVELQNGRNTATGDNFKAQMNTKLPDGSIVLQHFLDLNMPKTDGVGNIVGGMEPLFHFTDREMQSRYDELKAQGAERPIVQVMQEFDLYAEFENIAWMVNEMINPHAPAGYNATGLTGENFWNTPYIYYGTPKLVTYQTAKDFVEYIQKPEWYARTLTPEMKVYLAGVKEEIGFYTDYEIDNNLWMNKAYKWFLDNAIGQTWDWSLAYQAFNLDKAEPQMGLKTFADVGVDRNTVEATIGGNLAYWLDNKDTLGYGVMLFSPVPLDQTSTFDEKNYSSSSTNGYKPGPSEDMEEQGGKEARNNVVKFYSTKENGTYVYECNFTRKNTVGSILIEDELDGNYKVDSWYTSETFKEPVNENDSYDDWKATMENKQNGSGVGNVSLNPKETLYVRLVKADLPPGDSSTSEGTPTGLVLAENEISRQFSLSDANNGLLVDGVREYSSVSSDASCPEEVGEDEDGNTEYCGADYDYTGSENWSFTLENQPAYDKRFVHDWVQTDQKNYSGGGLSESGGTGSGTPEMSFILQRTIDDAVSLYPGLNPDKAALNAMGITAEGYVPANTRKDNAKEQATRKTWNHTFTTNWQFTNVNEPEAVFESDHGYTDTDNHSSTGNENELNGAYSKPGNTTIYGLWGKNNKGLQKITDTAQNNLWSLEGLNFKGFRTHIKEQPYNFYPYYKMQFVSELDGAEKDAYLTSENLSELLTVQRVDTSICRPNGATTLELTSNQWSLHGKAHKLLADYGVKDKNSLLPAGSIYDLRNSGDGVKASASWIGFRVFNSYIKDKGVLADSTGVKNKEEVLQTINNFKTSTEKVLDGYEVVMVGQEGINPDDSDKEFYDDSEVITGKAGKYQLGNKFIKDSKYDLQTGAEGANSSDINILEKRNKQYDWVISSDADGVVTISRNGEVLETLNKTQSSLTNAEVVEFNNRTLLITNFLNAIDRNMGSDRSGETWYNEGFSVGCIEERIAYRMGFGDGAENLRSTALNIKANGLLESRSDMFNGAEETIEQKARSYQFFTSEKSLVPEAGSKPKFWVGSYDGTDIFVSNINSLLMSKRFYTSNTTVTDLS